MTKGRRFLIFGSGILLLALVLTTCTFGPLDRKLNLLRLEQMARWSPGTALSESRDEGWSFPALASGQSFAFVQRTFRFRTAADAIDGQLEALDVADDDGWVLGALSDPTQTREKPLPLGASGELGAHVDPDDSTLVILTLKAFD